MDGMGRDGMGWEGLGRVMEDGNVVCKRPKSNNNKETADQLTGEDNNKKSAGQLTGGKERKNQGPSLNLRL